MDEITLRQMHTLDPAIRREGGSSTARKQSGGGTSTGPSFQDVLQERIATNSPRGGLATQSLKFSAHAQTRLQSRSIPFGPDEVARLQTAVNKAQAKGARESLILMDGVALLVSVKNRTVITAVDAASLKDNVFTNIDSAVIC